MLISRQITRRIRREQRELTGLLSGLRQRVERLGPTPLTADVARLESAFRQHAGMVHAILDAVSEDHVPGVNSDSRRES